MEQPARNVFQEPTFPETFFQSFKVAILNHMQITCLSAAVDSVEPLSHVFPFLHHVEILSSNLYLLFYSLYLLLLHFTKVMPSVLTPRPMIGGAVKNLQNFAVSPTRVTRHSASLLDLMLSTGDIDGACQTAYVDISDHYAIIAHLILPKQHRRQATTHKRRRDLHRVDWNAFNADLSSTLSDQSSDGDSDVETLMISLTKIILDTLNIHVPVKMKGAKSSRPCPWLT